MQIVNSLKFPIPDRLVSAKFLFWICGEQNYVSRDWSSKVFGLLKRVCSKVLFMWYLSSKWKRRRTLMGWKTKDSYINRQLCKRTEEHNGSDKKSAVFDHLRNCRNCQNFSNVYDLFSILNSCRRNHVYSLEALLIKKFKPSFNIQLGPSKGTKTSLSLY